MKTLNKKRIALILIGVVCPGLLLLTVNKQGNKQKYKDFYNVPNSLNETLYRNQEVPLTSSSGLDPLALTDHIGQMCKKLGMSFETRRLQPAMFDHILVDDNFKVLYCQVPKVACTNWRRVFLVLSGKVNVKDALEIKAADVHKQYNKFLTYLSDLAPDEIRYRLDHYYKFMFVREPFERLLSAYRNKLQGNTMTAQYFKEKFGRSIIQRFRDRSEGTNESSDVRFHEFLQYLVDPIRHQPLNEHWAKYYRLCHPCFIHYDLVGKYETLSRDAQHVLRSIRADHLVQFPSRSLSYKYNRTSLYLSSFYKDISPTLLRRVYRSYGPDFVLFNYSVPDDMKPLLQRL